MSQAIISESNLTAIANAIRTKNGSTTTYTPAQMATAITALPTVIDGTFTTNTTSGVQSVTIPYKGSGFPIAAVVFVDGGIYNNTSGGNSTWYNSSQRYAVGQWTLTKSQINTTPTWETSGSANYGCTTAVYKNTSSTSYTRTSAVNANIYTASNANSTATTIVRFKSKTSMSVYVADSSYGLLANCKYRYIIVYSS